MPSLSPTPSSDDDEPTGFHRPPPVPPSGEPEPLPVRPSAKAWGRLAAATKFFGVGGVLLLFPVLPLLAAWWGFSFGRAVLFVLGGLAVWAMIAGQVLRARWAEVHQALSEERDRTVQGLRAAFGHTPMMDGVQRGAFFFRSMNPNMRRPGEDAPFGSGRPQASPPPPRPGDPGENAHWAEATVVDEDEETS